MLEQILHFFVHNHIFWDFPLEKDVAELSWESYHHNTLKFVIPYININDNIAIELEENLSKNLTPYNDSQIFYDTIVTQVLEKDLKTINNLISAINNNVEVFLENCLYKPLTYEECIDLSHPFNQLLKVIAIKMEHNPFTINKDIFRLHGACLMKQMMLEFTFYTLEDISSDLESMERLFIKIYC